MQPEIRSFALLLRSPVNHAINFDSAKNANRFEKCNVFGNGKCELSAIQEEVTEVQIFGKEKRKTRRQY